MMGEYLQKSSVLVTMLALLWSGCGGKDCDTGSPDADATEEAEAVEDMVSDPDAIEDPADPDADPVEDPEEEDGELPDAPLPVDCDAIAESMTQERLLEHLEALETIATDNGGHRCAGTAGWTATIDYVQARLEEYGYVPSRLDSTYSYYEENYDPVLEMVSPTAHTYTFAVDDPFVMTGDFQRMHLSRDGDVTAEVTAVDLELGPGNTSTSGCETGDFAGFPRGNIALIQRGTCPYVTKANNADDANASAIILFNQGNTTERSGLALNGVGMVSLSPDDPEHGVDIPIVFATYDVGEAIATLLASGSVRMRVHVQDIFEVRPSQNLLADTAGGDPDDIIVYGAHLDSGLEGPGINDDGSGIATVLEIARLVSGCPLSRQFRFGFWATEEWGFPWGSTQYLAGLSDTELGRMSMYFNIDMIGSSNHALFVYDGDGSDYWVPGPAGSGELERWFVADLLLQGYPSLPYWGGSSDHFAFFMYDIAYAYLYTGGALMGRSKNDEEAALFGGTSGEFYHPCHHEACDNIENMNMDIAEVAAKSYARSAQFFGIDGLSVVPLP